MKLEETAIYPFIKHSPELCQLYTFSRASHIVNAEDANKFVWYLVSGRVKVVATGPNDKSFLVDQIEPDNFVGHLSNFHEQNFYCDSIAQTSCTLTRIPIETFNRMMDGLEFSRLFYYKTNCRLYNMYKLDLTHHLFTQRQQLAFYVDNNSRDGVCHIKSFNSLCESLRISRRNFYYLLDMFVKDGYLERTEDSDIRVLDPAGIKEIAKPLNDFYYNKL